MREKKTVVITGASGGIGAATVQRFVSHNFNVVATSRHVSQQMAPSDTLILIDGDITQSQTADKAVEAAIGNFGVIDVLVNNAGVFLTKPFIEFTCEDFNALISTNLMGFFHITQRAVKEMLRNQNAGCVVTITAALADRPIAGVNGSLSMITKGGLNAATRNLAVEYANQGIRFNAVAPGVVDTQLHRNESNASSSQAIMKKATVKQIVDAVLYLACAEHVNGEVLHVDNAAPARRW